MLKVFLVLFIGLSNLPKTIPCIAQYGQCGGLKYTGSTECCAPSTCKYSNPWYSQCIQSSSSSTSGCSAVYGQCGGQKWSEPTCCVYITCTYSNIHYSQCLTPLSNSNSSTSSSSPSTSPNSSSSPSTSSSTTTTTTASTSSISTSSTNHGCSALYSQCGGIGWNGPTTCCSGSTCTFGNDYYSQCLTSGGSSSSSSSSSSNIGSSITIPSGNDGYQSGVTTRYWDCCKASCGWTGKASVTNPVQTCAQDGVTIVDANAQSGCNGGSAYMCTNQQPWSVSSTLSYGYAAAHISGQSESDWCCACYSLKFTSGPVFGKELIVQVTNTGGDLGSNHFDLQIPGGGVGIFDGCSSQFPGSYSWGQRYGGVSQRSDCDNLPGAIRSGCYWRFDWFLNSDNPSINFKQVTCPSALTKHTQCARI